MKLLASQAAIALENAHLYRDVAEREAKIRRLVDSNIIGIVIGDVGGGFSRPMTRFFTWWDMTVGIWPPVASAEPISRRPNGESVVNARAELSSTGTVQPYEKEYFRKDGGRVPVLIEGALFEPDPCPHASHSAGYALAGRGVDTRTNIRQHRDLHTGVSGPDRRVRTIWDR